MRETQVAPTRDELHIASLVVHVQPSLLQAVEQALAALQDKQVHGTHPNGKLVVTLEGPSAHNIMDQIAEIRLIAGVLNVSLVYQHAEPLHLFHKGLAHD